MSYILKSLAFGFILAGSLGIAASFLVQDINVLYAGIKVLAAGLAFYLARRIVLDF